PVRIPNSKFQILNCRCWGPAAMSRLLGNLLLFGRILRAAGIAVHPGRLLDVVSALDPVVRGAREEVYSACRALLVHRPEQIAIFDRAFDAFWTAHTGGASEPAGKRTEPPDAPGQRPVALAPESG